MSKYFKDDLEEKIFISEFIEELEKETKEYEKKHRYKSCDERTIKEAKCVMKDLGDVLLPRSVIRTLSSQFHCFGGKYDVRCEKETFQEIYKIHTMYPELTARALEEIIFIYIKDLFDKYSFSELLGKFIKVMGKSDETFEIYYDYVDRKGKELQKEYEEKAKKLEDYRIEYGDKYIDFLKDLIMSMHIDVDKIISIIPEAHLVSEDEKQLYDLSSKTRIFFGVGYPVSYMLTRDLAKRDDISRYPEELSYYIDVMDKSIPATFTKTEFLESIKKQKQLKK